MQQREGIFSEDLNKFNNGIELNRIDPFTLQQIEYYLQQQVTYISFIYFCSMASVFRL